MDKPKRKNIRMSSWDYKTAATYHVTICTQGKVCRFGRVIDPAKLHGSAYVELAEDGMACDSAIREATDTYQGVELFNYVVMPNHVHLLIGVSSSNDGQDRKSTRLNSSH